LTLDQAERLLDLPDVKTNKGKRDHALLALLVGCGLRRQELADLRIEDIQGVGGPMEENRVKVMRFVQVLARRSPSGDIFQSIGRIPKGTELAPRY
jgi:integrase